MKQVMVHFDSADGTIEQYDSVWEDLRASGNDHPDGLLFHIGAAKPNKGFLVTDLWESAEQFKKFGEVLMPILQKRNLEMTEPLILEARNVYEGHASNVV